MPAFTATEFDAENCMPTGRQETYLGANAEHAARNCLYTKRLANGRAEIGPTKLVVYSGKFGYVITKGESP